MAQTDPMIAAWRRKYGFAWKVTSVIEGVDEEYVSWHPGCLSLMFAEAVAKSSAAERYKCDSADVHIVRTEKD